MNGYLSPAETLEETPDMYSDDEPMVKTTGNTTSCYTCARSFSQLPAEYTVKRNYQYSINNKKVGYFLTFCVWCAHQHSF